MSNVKARMAALSLLDRSITALTDEELLTAIHALPEDHRDAVARLAHVPAEADDATWAADVRTAATKGRMNGTLEQLATVLTDPALADCIEQLGDHADAPSEEELRAVLPGVAERHGLGMARVMMASAVVGEAHASPTLIRLLKTDETYALPKVETPRSVTVVDDGRTEDERAKLRDARKARRQQEQAEARARREQAARARGRA